MLTIDGELTENTNAHAHSLAADGQSWHLIEGRGWVLRFLADAGTVVHIGEWPRPQGAVIRCDDAGFSSGTIAVDGGPAAPTELGSPIEIAQRQFELRLEAQDGSRAFVDLRWLTGSGVTLRVSR
jgi:hypothetical protein